MDNFFPIHVRTLTGLEGPLAEELTALGAKDAQSKNRVVICRGDRKLLYQANLWCRTAIRVLLPLATFPAKDEETFYKAVKNIDWTPWLSADGTLAIDAHVHSSFTTHSLFLAQLTKDAIVDQFRDTVGRRPSVSLESPDLRVAVSLFQDNVQIFVDSSGESLHKRGYRQRAGDAPLSETLAAGIIHLSGWDGKTPLLDPMTGSGTLLIEAALKLKNVAPGLGRREFGFQRWKDYDRALFESLVAQAKSAIRSDVSADIRGFDKDASIIAVARENVERAGLTGLVRIDHGDFFEMERPAPVGTIVMNPPYDERLSVDDVGELYERIGMRLAESYGGWTAHVLTGNLDAAKYIGLRSSKRFVVFNGSIECRLLRLEIREGTRVSRVEEPPQWKERTESFANRLRKNTKHLSKWAKRENISCFRVYDRDIPELPFIVDIYEGCLHFAEVPRNHDHSPVEHVRYMKAMVKTAAEVLGISMDKVTFKKRQGQKGETSDGKFIEVQEGGHRFFLNLTDFVDVGLSLELRKNRARIEKEAKGKDVLNLFSYTGAFTVYAAAGGAKSTTTVDTTKTYLDWTIENLKLNQLTGPSNEIIRLDAVEFLQTSRAKFDICIVDPPARWTNRVTAVSFDIQADHVRLLRLVMDRTRTGGKIYFSTSYRSFKLDEEGLKKDKNISVKEISREVTSVDFERNPSHRTWQIEVLG